MTIDQALDKGIAKLRHPNWKIPGDHIELYITKNKKLGPWVKFYSPLNETVGNDNPVTIPIIAVDKSDEWEPYEDHPTKEEV